MTLHTDSSGNDGTSRLAQWRFGMIGIVTKLAVPTNRSLTALCAFSLLVGCGGSSASTPNTAAQPGPVTHTRPNPQRPNTPVGSRDESVCPPPSHVLDGVYHPQRLTVLDPCRRASGTVVTTSVEQDGDLHF